MAFVQPDTEAFLGKRVSQMGDVDLRFERGTGCRRVSRFRFMASHFADRTCGRRASRFFRESFYVDFGPVSFTRGRLGGGNWRHGGGSGGDAFRRKSMTPFAMD